VHAVSLGNTVRCKGQSVIATRTSISTSSTASVRRRGRHRRCRHAAHCSNTTTVKLTTKVPWWPSGDSSHERDESGHGHCLDFSTFSNVGTFCSKFSDSPESNDACTEQTDRTSSYQTKLHCDFAIREAGVVLCEMSRTEPNRAPCSTSTCDIDFLLSEGQRDFATSTP
jgi:acyl-CoA hydrolase